MRKHVMVGLLAGILLVSLKLALEVTPVGRALEMQTYALLHSVLPAHAGERLPIVVVDISDVPGGKDHPTPRARLQELIDALITVGPKAIGVATDFSPNESGWQTLADVGFFDHCLATSQAHQVPIFLGVSRTHQEPADTWLGLAKYQSMAAAGVLHPTDTRRVPRRVRALNAAQWLPTLSEALAMAYRDDLPEAAPWIAWALARRLPHQHSGISVDVMVNYSKLKQIDSEHIPISQVQAVQDARRHLQGRLVLLGDVRAATQTFNVPGHATPIPGVYLLAAAAYSLAFAPLYEFTHSARIGLDLLISVFIVIGACWIRFRGHPAAISNRKHLGRFILASVIGVMVAGVLLVRLSGILWLDFLLAPFAVLLHPKVEAWLANHLRPRARTPRAADA